MAEIVFVPVFGKQIGINSEELNTIVRGASIIWMREEQPNNLSKWIDEEQQNTLEVITSDECSIRVRSAQTLRVEVNEYGSLRPHIVRINIFDRKTDDGPAGVPAQEIERRIHALRQLYALTFLLEADRIDDVSIGQELSEIDLEQILNDDERLRFLATGVGSFWVTLGNLTDAGKRAIIAIAGMFYEDGRQALLKHLRAQAESAELDVQKKRMELDFAKADKVLDSLQRIEKIRDPAFKATVRSVLTENMRILDVPVNFETYSDDVKGHTTEESRKPKQGY